MGSGESGRRRLTALGKNVARGARRLGGALGFAPLPFRVHLDLTDRCNGRCPTCFKWREPATGRELSSEEWRPIFERLRGRVLSRRVTIGGGEPLLRADLGRIVSDLKAQGLHVSLITNALLLDAARALDLESRGLDGLVISLNSRREAVHDATRGTPGSARHILSLLPDLARRRFTTAISTIVVDRNLDDLEGLVDLVEETGLAGIVFQVLVSERVHHVFAARSAAAVAPDWYRRDPLWVRDAGRLAAVMDRLIARKQAGAPIANTVGHLRAFKAYYTDPPRAVREPCLAGVTSFHVDPYGRVRLCYGFGPIGDLRRQTPLAIWRSAAARACRRAMRRCAQMCRLQNNNY
jgi:MoaA/NifB/PqqE/SkfB family radical SAM enzyme